MQRGAPAGAQHAVYLPVEATFVSYVHRAVLRPCRVEAGVGVGYLEGAAVPEGDEIAQASTSCERSSCGAEIFGKVQHLDCAAELASEGTRRFAQPTADIEHQHPRLDTGEARSAPRVLARRSPRA